MQLGEEEKRRSRCRIWDQGGEVRGSWRGGAATRPRSRAARGREDELLAQSGVEETVQGVRRGRYCPVYLLVITEERISHRHSKLFCLGDKQTSAGG